jgi:hypothetical protein
MFSIDVATVGNYFVGGTLAALMPWYAALLYRRSPTRELAIVLAGVAVLLARTGASYLISEYDITVTPRGATFSPNRAHECLSGLALAARAAIVFGLVGLLRQPTQRPNEESSQQRPNNLPSSVT